MRKLIIAGIIIAVLFVSLAIFGIVFNLFAGSMINSIEHSEPTETAKVFLRQNQKLKDYTGEVRESPSFLGGDINTNDAGGSAQLSFKVAGEKKEVAANVSLRSQNKGRWHIADADYVNDAGETVNLLDK